jgi:hypothetical protein
MTKMSLLAVGAIAVLPMAPHSCAPAPRQSARCDPNYSGCVPIASDVDCAGGSGNGPAYTGRARVIGRDIYGIAGE